MIKITEGFKAKLATAKISKMLSVAVLAFLTVAVVAVILLSVNKITVNADGQTKTYYSTHTDTASILKQLDIQYTESDQIAVEQTGKSLTLSVIRSFPVTVTLGSESREIKVTGGTVSDAISLAGFEISEHDLVNLSLDTVLTKTEYIDIVDVEYVTETKTESIPYNSTTVYSDEYPTTVTKVTTKGKEGEKQVTVLKKYENGVLSNEEVVEEIVLSDKIDKVITVGTKEVKTSSYDSISTISVLDPSFDIVLDENGIPVNYTGMKVVQATGYSPKDGTATATGVTAKPGYIAVNPDIIPYGTKMFIRSTDGRYIYGYAVAADTGGFINSRPTNVDLFFSTTTQARQFGRRNVEIYFLAD